MYRDDAMLMVWTTKELQPEGARFLFEYPILPQAQFEQEFKDAREGRMCHYPLADVFDGLEWEDESEEPETDAGTNGGDVEAGAPGHSGSGQREGVSSQRSQG